MLRLWIPPPHGNGGSSYVASLNTPTWRILHLISSWSASRYFSWIPTNTSAAWVHQWPPSWHGSGPIRGQDSVMKSAVTIRSSLSPSQPPTHHTHECIYSHCVCVLKWWAGRTVYLDTYFYSLNHHHLHRYCICIPYTCIHQLISPRNPICKWTDSLTVSTVL